MGRVDSKKKSMAEAITNTIIGFFIGVGLNIYILPPLMGIEYYMSFEISAIISVLYGGVSLFRAYILRRFFIRYV